MKDSIYTPDDLTLDQIMDRFNTDEAAREYFEHIRWPDGKVCPHCRNNHQRKIWKVKANVDKKIRHGLYMCAKCSKQFTATVGTIFEDSHIPMRKWLVAFYLFSSSKKGISALQIQRILNLGSYRSAHFMMHRIRYAVQDQTFDKKLAGTVEVDETYVGGKARNTHKTQASGYDNKIPVVSLVERNGNVRSIVVDRVTAKTLKDAITTHIAPNSTIVTDEALKYKRITKGFRHYSVNHSKKEFARKIHKGLVAHTNTVESTFALLKRGIIGTFHTVSRKHLPLYMAEFDHRWNNRHVSDGQTTVNAIQKVGGKRLMYKQAVNHS